MTIKTIEKKITSYNSHSSQKKLYIQSYGCAMNFSDSEIVASILKKEGFPSWKN